MTNAAMLCADELRARPPRALVLGGSAGGVEALKSLLPALPRDLSVPVLVVVHMAAETRAVWPVVFEGTQLRVLEAEDKDVAEPGSVYIAPPNYHLLVGSGGRLSLSIDARVQYSRPSIDVLFESAADSYREHVLGVVLSGANADGAEGLARIARAGGHAWVQSPATAAASFMPQSALAAVPGARALSLDDMAHVFQSGALGGNTSRGQHG
jgi:two-component system, chemotaxis family, protein-glutamate methylesterase/glutaminase